MPSPADAALQIDIACTGDIEALSVMSRDLIERGLRWRYRPERMRALLRDPNICVVVARQGDRRVGFAAMSFGSRLAHLILLAVEHDARRLGVGARLLGWLEESAKVAGIGQIVLEVRAANRGARSFYREQGYGEQTYLENYYDGVESAFRMTRRISVGTPVPVQRFGRF